VENRKGGSGAVAMSYVQSLPSDGYTLLSTTGSMTFSMATGKVPFGVDDFTYLTTAQAEPSSIAVLDSSPLKTLEDFIKVMKEEPGKLSIGGYASGGFHNFVMHKFSNMVGFEATWVPFDGGADAVTALLGGHIDVAFITPSSALSHIQEGKIRLLAISTPERSQNFPDVPTFKEKGYDLVEMLWRGIMAKKGLPEDRKEIILSAINKAMDSEEFKKYMTDFNQEEFRVAGEEMKQLVIKELEERKQFATELGLVK
jgi:tripartite-type tricarboxylate transporter receptor subunit TctC